MCFDEIFQLECKVETAYSPRKCSSNIVYFPGNNDYSFMPSIATPPKFMIFWIKQKIEIEQNIYLNASKWN